MRITVLFDNLGPYHIARLSAAAKVCKLSVIELNAESCDYQWSREPGELCFDRHTVFRSEGARRGSITQWAKKVTSAIEATNPEIVAIPGWSGWHAFAALQWCARRSVPAILMSESSRDDEPRAAWKEWIKRRCVAMCFAGLVGGHRNREYLVELGMPSERIFFGYDVVDNGYFADVSDTIRRDPGKWRQQFHLPERYFLASARFIPKKNLPSLLRAYARYRDDATHSQSGGRPDAWDLVILGDGPDREQLQQLSRSLEVSECVHFPGFRQYQDLPGYYALASAFIHPSTIEPWGLVVNEAMAAHLPVLVSQRCGCAQTLVQHGENGYTFDPADIEEMSKQMLLISQASADSRKDMGRRSGELIAEFGPPRFAEGLRQAADMALRTGAKSRHMLDSVLLQSLVLKSFPAARPRVSR